MKIFSIQNLSIVLLTVIPFALVFLANVVLCKEYELEDKIDFKIDADVEDLILVFATRELYDQFLPLQQFFTLQKDTSQFIRNFDFKMPLIKPTELKISPVYQKFNFAEKGKSYAVTKFNFRFSSFMKLRKKNSYLV